MEKVELYYSRRYLDAVTASRGKYSSVGVFSSDGELLGVVWGDPDGVHIWGRVDILSSSYITGGGWEITLPKDVIIKRPVWGYKSCKRGRVFVFKVGGENTLPTYVGMRVGESLPDLINKRKKIGMYVPYFIPLPPLLCSNETEFIVNSPDTIINPSPNPIHVGFVVGVHPEVLRKIFVPPFDWRGDYIPFGSMALFVGYGELPKGGKMRWGYYIMRKERKQFVPIAYTETASEAVSLLGTVLAFHGEDVPQIEVQDEEYPEPAVVATPDWVLLVSDGNCVAMPRDEGMIEYHYDILPLRKKKFAMEMADTLRKLGVLLPEEVCYEKVGGEHEA